LSHRYSRYCFVHMSLYLASHYSYVVTSRVLLLLRRNHALLFFSPSIP